MNNFHFPSSDFPAPPGLQLQADDEWVVVRTPGTVMSLVRRPDDSAFAANIVVTETRHSADFDVSELIRDLADEAVQRGGSAEEPPFSTELNGRPYHGRTIVIQDPRAGTLAQLHLAAAIDHSGVRDVVHLVGTCSGARITEDFPILQTVMGTVTIDAPERA